MEKVSFVAYLGTAIHTDHTAMIDDYLAIYLNFAKMFMVW